jgi:lysozyme family protein
MSSFEKAMEFVLQNEMGLEENNKDPGGITNCGISLRFLKSLSEDLRKKYGIFDQEINEDTIRCLRLTQAKLIYKGEFWDCAPFEKIENQEHCNYIFDMAVNLGISPAIKCVQRACWAVMKRWENLEDDGILGNNTIQAIKMCGMFIMPPIRAERGSFYRSIVEKSPEQREFLKGWYDRTYNTV